MSYVNKTLPSSARPYVRRSVSRIPGSFLPAQPGRAARKQRNTTNKYKRTPKILRRRSNRKLRIKRKQKDANERPRVLLNWH